MARFSLIKKAERDHSRACLLCPSPPRPFRSELTRAPGEIRLTSCCLSHPALFHKKPPPKKNQNKTPGSWRGTDRVDSFGKRPFLPFAVAPRGAEADGPLSPRSPGRGPGELPQPFLHAPARDPVRLLPRISPPAGP